MPRSASARGCQRGPAARPGPPCALRRRYRSTEKIKRKQEAGRRRAERPARYGRKSGAKLPLRSVLLLAAAEQPLPGAELRPFRAKRSLPRKVLRINPEPAARAPGAGLKGAPLVWRPRSPAGTRCRPAARHSSAPLGCRESPYFPRLLKVTVGHVWERGAAQGAEGVGKCFCWAARPNLVRAWGGSGGKGSVTGVVARCRNHLSELRAARSANCKQKNKTPFCPKERQAAVRSSFPQEPAGCLPSRREGNPYCGTSPGTPLPARRSAGISERSAPHRPAAVPSLLGRSEPRPSCGGSRRRAPHVSCLCAAPR